MECVIIAMDTVCSETHKHMLVAMSLEFEIPRIFKRLGRIIQYQGCLIIWLLMHLRK